MVELSLVHDGRFWIATGESWNARGETLEELDRAVGKIAREREKPDGDRCLEVRMTFDNTVIPEWIRQYSNHYFNRLITVDFPPDQSDESEF
jgi:hypothetical protein